jgi:hypothetical protein
MAEVDDGYPEYYTERLWQLLPGVYRTADALSAQPESLEEPGPLRELVARIGGQMAVVRRSIDRLWADQSIETCDDWVIPYIGDLLGTNLAGGDGARARRLDVAKTIHYRRRKGTVEVLQEIARDATGWEALVLEGFRRLARTRHGLDPGLGPAAYPGAQAAQVPGLLRAEGLVGVQSSTPAGGLLDLRDAHAATLTGSAFDEGYHHLDVRAGTQALGHHSIHKLLVFLWRLRSFAVQNATPVAVAGCEGRAYTFDPTGRDVPLFLPRQPEAGAARSVAREWQLPGPLTRGLAELMAASGSAEAQPAYAIDGAVLSELHPELGRFSTRAAPAGELTASYSYGFPSTIGAGPYDRALLGDPPAQVQPVRAVNGGGSKLEAALAVAAPSATVFVEDSLTYTALAPAGSSGQPLASLLCQAGPEQRPVIRVAPGGPPWVLTGGPGAELVLDGLLLSGCDLVLRGSFASVRLTGCTIDPGTAAAGASQGAPGMGASPLATAVDGVPLSPTRIFVEADPGASAGSAGTIGALSIDHCVCGPIRTRLGGAIETLSISDSIVQAVPTSTASTYGQDDVYDPLLLAQGLIASGDALSQSLHAQLPAGASEALQSLLAKPEGTLDPRILEGLNALVEHDGALYDPASYPGVVLDAETLALHARAATLDAAAMARLNRGLLDGAFPVALGLAAIAVADAEVTLERVTVLGGLAAQRLSAGDTILSGLSVAQDTQDGCVRFSAVATGSSLAREYRSVAIEPAAGIFASEAFGDPAYGQLLDSADGAIRESRGGGSLLRGAESGAQMGAYSSDLDALGEQALLSKYTEYMPLGMTPVVVHVT